MPRRIQRKRAKGWRMPAGAVYVGRPTIWGNPFKVGSMTAAQAVAAYRRIMTRPVTLFDTRIALIHPLLRASKVAEAQSRLDELRGKDLACWCPLSAPCHADVLLELANTPATEGQEP